MTKADLWELLKVILQALGLISGLGGFILALKQFIGSKLSVHLVSKKGEPTRYGDSTNAPLAFFYHLKVSNSKWIPARNVRVLLTRISKVASNGTFPNEDLPGSIQLKWQWGTENERCSGRIIGARGKATANLGFIVETYSYFQLDPCVWPPNFSGLINANEEMLVEVVAEADNGRSNTLRIYIKWDGQWSKDAEEMQYHLRLIPEYV